MWVIDFEFSGNEINYIDKISSSPITLDNPENFYSFVYN
jgi:hypothetical protein